MALRARSALVVALAGALALAAISMPAAEITLRLVRGDAPDRLVSTATTEINIAAERAKARADAEAAKARAALAGKELVLEDKPVRPQAEFDRYCNYMRGIVIDGTIPFQRSYKGSYLGRSDVVKLDLVDGPHRLDPGNHGFTVLNGAAKTDDPSLKANGATLDILLQPVTIMAIDGGAIRALPAEVLRLPVAPRLRWGEESILPKEENLAEDATFKRLTLYMLANPSGAPYRVEPSGRSFRVSENGITVLDRDGKPAVDRGAYVEDKFTLVLPKVPVPVQINGRGVQLLIAGEAGRLQLGSRPDQEITTGVFYAYGAPEGAEISAGVRARGQPLHFDGDLGAFPRRKILIDATAPESAEPRLLAVALPQYSVGAGKTLRVRVQFQDALDAPTAAPAEIGAFLWKKPVLEADGWLQPAPPVGTAAPVEGWHALRVAATDQPGVYDLSMPDVAGNVYWLRLAVGHRGLGSPRSPLQTDFLLGVTSPAATFSVSVFAPLGRHGFVHGSALPFSIVVKSPTPLPAGTLRATFKRDGRAYPLLEQQTPALPAGGAPFHFLLSGDATAALTPGDYTLEASFAEVPAMPWTVRISPPLCRAPFPRFSQSFGAPTDIDKGSPYLNVPEDIAQANLRRVMFRRTASILGLFDTLNCTDWSVHGMFARYQGRDSSSEVVQVEAILRQAAALPAHEAYYYQNNFEAAMEWLAWEGLGEFNNSLDPFAPRSVVHSVPTEVNARMRDFQLIAQLAQRFDNFTGLTLVKDDTTPIGDTEVGDSGRTIRLSNQLDNFKAKYGAEPPAMGKVEEFLQLYLKKADIPPAAAETARLWEAWIDTQNHILSDFYAAGHEAVDPILPGLRFGTLGPGWGGTLSGGYPALAHQFQNPLTVQSGTGDYGHQLIIDPFLRTRFFQMAGTECWGVLGCWGAGGFYNQKDHLAGWLAAGATGFGFYSGWKREITAPDVPGNAVWQEERRDIRDLLDTYGPMFRQVRPVADIAVFYPYHQSMYDHLNRGVARNFSGYTRFSCYAAMAQLALYGYNSEILTEEMIDAGELKRFKAVILPGLYYALPKHREALENFAAGGGLVLAGSTSTLLPKGARKIDDDFLEFGDADGVWSFNKLLDVGHAWLFTEMRRKAPVLRQAIAPVLSPYAQAVTDRVLVQTSRAGDGRCTFVWDLLFPSWMGTSRVNPGNAEWSMLGEANEGTLMPLRETISFPAAACVYELFTQQRVTETNPKTGRLETVADLSFTPFRIYVSLPRPIATLRIEAPERVTLGTHFPVLVTPLDAAGAPLQASIPVRLRLLDPAGREVWTQAGASFPQFAGDLSAPLGAPAGDWRLVVDELISGRRAEVALPVREPPGLPFAANLTALPAADVQRPELVGAFLAARQKDGETVFVLLGESQYTPRLALAKEAVQALTTLGVKAEIRRTDEPGVFATGERVHLYKNWQDMKPAQYIDHHAVLLGGEGESVLIEELQENQLLVRPLTASYPGPGRGTIALIRSPFAFNRDVLGLFGPDEAGIRAAIRQLAIAAAAPTVATAPAAKPALVARDLAGALQPGTPFATMDGAPTQLVRVNRDGSRIAFGVLGYAKNLFVFGADGALQIEDKIGHINTLALTLLDDGRMVVGSDGSSYLRGADGKLAWRVFDFGKKIVVDPAGRYFVLASGNGFEVRDLSGRVLWAFDEWSKYATTQEILFARKASFLCVLDRGDTLAYRLTGKAPGITGSYGDEVVCVDALTGKERRRLPLDLAKIQACAGVGTNATLEELTLDQNGAWAVAELKTARKSCLVLLDKELRPVAGERFETPLYIGGTNIKTAFRVLADGRLLFTVGDTLCVSNREWTALRTVQTRHLILSMALDEARGRVAVANYAGELLIHDLELKPLWHADLDSAADLAFLPDGRLAAGSLRGQAYLFGPDGVRLWQASLNRFAAPAEVEARWTAIEATPALRQENDLPWWERLVRNVDLGADIAKLAGTIAAEPLTAACAAEPFGTYLVEWRHGRAQGGGALSLEISEMEKAEVPGAAANRIARLTLSATPGTEERTERALLRVGDRPESIQARIQGAGAGSAFSALSIRPLAFPSADLIRIGSLYRGRISEAERANPPVAIDLFMNVAEKGGPHITRWADPFCFVNGRMLDSEPGLLDGKWFGSGNFFMADNFASVPCWIELKLPRKRVISHIAVAEDPNLERCAVLAVDAYVETQELRKDLSAFEQRQLKRGFWYNVVKRRGNTDTYNVYKLDKPVFTSQLRVYVLGGYSSLTEIELYGGLPAEAKKTAAPPPADKP